MDHVVRIEPHIVTGHALTRDTADNTTAPNVTTGPTRDTANDTSSTPRGGTVALGGGLAPGGRREHR